MTLNLLNEKKINSVNLDSMVVINLINHQFKIPYHGPVNFMCSTKHLKACHLQM